jgi:uncharacterized protein
MLILEIKVTPSSGKSEISLDKQGRIKAFLKNPPEGGKANHELLKLLSHALKCPMSALSIIRGATHRSKTIKIDLPLSYGEVLSRLGLSHQTSLIG